MQEQPSPDAPARVGFATQLKWLLTIFIQPRKTFTQIAEQPKKRWLLPLLVLSVVALIHANVSAHTSLMLVPDLKGMQDVDIQLPEGAELPENLDVENVEIIEVSDTGNMPAAGGPPLGGVSWLFDGIGSLIRIWGVWLLISAMLYLSLTLSGGRVENRPLMNVVAWAGMPLVLRDLVQIASMSLTHQPILNPGLSGLWMPGESTLSWFLLALLGMVDIYLIWNLALLVIGGKTVSGLGTGKTLKAVLIPVLLLLALYALGTVGMQTLVFQIREGASFMGGGF